ncbi:hypothetical protein DFH07DRAFT_954217 [Mycena maculata]|uniref:RNA-dependent RNA polymerase n=1 Tax=Mycena maculata TaxID=230809 RepID=A0AAD7JQF3_9AGAR|nr:hypothetical protein DFH07DRAFT_954217 [Mycena maculata]
MLLAGHDMNESCRATLLWRFQTASRKVLHKKLNIPTWQIHSQCICSAIDLSGPAGVQVIQAVNESELKHLTNCIVFAASGAHSETDRMGGG